MCERESTVQSQVKEIVLSKLRIICVCEFALRILYYLPHAGLFAVHHSHVVDFVLLDVPLLRLIELLRNEAHE